MEESISSAVALATVGALAFGVKQVIDLIRRYIPSLNNGLVVGVSVVLGTFVAFYFDLRFAQLLASAWAAATGAGDMVGRVAPAWLDYIITGVAIGLGAGYLADREKATASTTAVVTIGEVEADPF